MGIRVVKTSLAAILAIYIAKFFGLEFYLAAGLLAILGIDTTRISGLKNSLERIFASVLGLLFAALLFYLFDFHIWVLALFICIAFPVIAKVNLGNGIVTSCVVVFHIFSMETVSFSAIMNEIWLLLIGLGCATVINFLYMPSEDANLLKTRLKVEDLFAAIFYHISSQLKDVSYLWDGHELLEVEEVIEAGILLAKKSSENALFHSKAEWQIYYHMRNQQLASIERMMDIVAQVFQTLPHGVITAELFEELADEVKNEFYTGQVEAKLLDLVLLFKQMPLPVSREEFEVRSAILQLSLELKHYLSYSKKAKKRKISI